MKIQDKITPYFLTIIFPLLLLFSFDVFGILDFWNKKLSDVPIYLFPEHHKFSNDIVILDIDEHSLAHYANHPEVGRWPWRRSIYPSIYAFLNMAEAKFIVNDILFTENSQDDESLALANSIFPNISHSAAFRADEFKLNQKYFNLYERFSLGKDDSLQLAKFDSASFPNGKIGETAPHIHIVNVMPDKDGILRRFAPIVTLVDTMFPTLSLVAFFENQEIDFSFKKNELVLRKDGKSNKYPINKRGFIRSYYYSSNTLQNIPRYSASDVLETYSRIIDGRVEDESQLLIPLEYFKDKIVILGTTAPGTHDDVVTPLGLYPGVIVQANFVSNLIENHCLFEIPMYWGNIFALLFLLLISYFLLISDNNLLRIIIPFGLFILIGISSFLLYKIDILMPLAPFLITLPLSFILGYAYVTYKEGFEKRKYNSVLRNLIDPSVVSLALHDIEALKQGGEWEITAFFSDVVSFSEISEELTATDLARLLNEYLSSMTDELKKNLGTLDKYIGDAIVGIFGAPIKNESHPIDACNTALAMLSKMKELNHKWSTENSYTSKAQKMQFRIGLNCGLAKVGFMGTDSLASYTMMGDTVNIAARLEAAAKDYGVPILVSENIYNKCKDRFDFWKLDAIRVKGRENPLSIYSLNNYKGLSSTRELEFMQIYENAFNEYQNMNWAKAISLFESAIALNETENKACDLLINRCKIYYQQPPKPGWDGVFTRLGK